jgi:hypothetical protein
MFFQEDRKDVEEDPCSGPLKMNSNPELFDEVCNLVARDCQLMLRMMANELIVSEESVKSIITTDLGKRIILQSLCHTVFMMRKNS